VSKRRSRKFTRGHAIGVAVFVGGILFGAMMGEYSTIDWYKLEQQIRAEQQSVARLEVEVDSLSAYADSIETNRLTQERVARERFGMLEEDEILYMWEPKR
jgi:cell division protein FtsB